MTKQVQLPYSSARKCLLLTHSYSLIHSQYSRRPVFELVTTNITFIGKKMASNPREDILLAPLLRREEHESVDKQMPIKFRELQKC